MESDTYESSPFVPLPRGKLSIRYLFSLLEEGLREVTLIDEVIPSDTV
jgi:hypothetical protein